MSEPYYRTAEWHRLRAEVLRRQPICATPGCGAASQAVDHVVPRSKGGPDTLGNLRGLCVPCHNQRRRGGEPRAKGCDAAGMPRDPGHWWHQGASPHVGNLSQLGTKDRSGAPFSVSSPRRGRS